MKTLWCALSLFAFSGVSAHAQAPSNAPVPQKGKTATATPAPAQNALPLAPPHAAATPAPVAEKNPWTLFYEGEYVGPRLTNIAIDETQGPDDTTPSYGEWDHRIKFGHTLFSDDFSVGLDQAASQSFDPLVPFTMGDLRIFATLKNVIDNDWLNMAQGARFQFPTTDAAKKVGLNFRVDIKNTFTPKTSSQIVSWKLITVISPRFYKVDALNPDKPQTDFMVAAIPIMDVKISDPLAFQLDGAFDMNHTVVESTMDFNSAESDYFDTGLVWDPMPHVELNPAIRTYTGNISLKASVLYLDVSISI